MYTTVAYPVYHCSILLFPFYLLGHFKWDRPRGLCFIVGIFSWWEVFLVGRFHGGTFSWRVVFLVAGFFLVVCFLGGMFFWWNGFLVGRFLAETFSWWDLFLVTTVVCLVYPVYHCGIPCILLWHTLSCDRDSGRRPKNLSPQSEVALYYTTA